MKSSNAKESGTWSVLQTTKLSGNRGSRIRMIREVWIKGNFVECEFASVVDDDMSTFFLHGSISHRCPFIEELKTITIGE